MTYNHCNVSLNPYFIDKLNGTLPPQYVNANMSKKVELDIQNRDNIFLYFYVVNMKLFWNYIIGSYIKGK